MEAAITARLPGEKSYGSRLVQVAFSGANPPLRLGTVDAEAGEQEHKAAMHLALGLYLLRNSVAHGDPVIFSEADARAPFRSRR